MNKNRTYKENERQFISIVLFYDSKFLKMGTQENGGIFSFYGSFL